jgi:hypothetical protein
VLLRRKKEICTGEAEIVWILINWGQTDYIIVYKKNDHIELEFMFMKHKISKFQEVWKDDHLVLDHN